MNRRKRKNCVGEPRIAEARSRIAQTLESPQSVLDLSGLGLRELPAQLRDLSGRLQILYAGDNRLSSLPDFLSELPLRKLFLGGNRFADFPAEISKLHLLTKLDISENGLRGVPHFVGELRHLFELDLSHNKLRHLPASMTSLQKLVRLHLDDNPHLKIPSPVLTASPREILAYLAAANRLRVSSEDNAVEAAKGPRQLVFVSYCRADREYAEEIVARVRERGVSVWFDREQPPGRNLLNQVRGGLDNASVVWSLFGPHGVGRVQKEELEEAQWNRLQRKIPIVPVLLPGVDRSCLNETGLAKLGWVDLKDGLDEAALKQLLASIPEE